MTDHISPALTHGLEDQLRQDYTNALAINKETREDWLMEALGNSIAAYVETLYEEVKSAETLLDRLATMYTLLRVPIISQQQAREICEWLEDRRR